MSHVLQYLLCENDYFMVPHRELLYTFTRKYQNVYFYLEIALPIPLETELSDYFFFE